MTAPGVTPPPAPGSPVDVLARTLWGEARGEAVAGKQAVASVVLNRVRRARERGGRYWWGASIEEVCRRPWQFSCWNESDPNRAKLEKVGMDNPAFRQCVRVASQAVAGTLDDATGGATHYHTAGIDPPWSRGRIPSATIGRHLFYNDVE
jgi:spore germination cell wall hydrolase CwlJ-like protein